MFEASYAVPPSHEFRTMELIFRMRERLAGYKPGKMKEVKKLDYISFEHWLGDTDDCPDLGEYEGSGLYVYSSGKVEWSVWRENGHNGDAYDTRTVEIKGSARKNTIDAVYKALYAQLGKHFDALIVKEEEEARARLAQEKAQERAEKWLSVGDEH